MIKDDQLPGVGFRRFIVLLVVSVCTIQIGTVLADDWPQWRGANSDGVSAESGWSTQWPRTGPKVLWKKAVGKGYSAVSVSDGRAYTMGNVSNVDNVYCFDAATGKVIWQQSYNCSASNQFHGTRATPTVDGPFVYTHSREGHVYCFDAKTGKVIWKKNLADELGAKVPKWGLAASPVVEGDVLIINIGTAGTALDKLSGEVLWTTGTEVAGYSTPYVYEDNGKKRVAVFAAKKIMGLDFSTGKTLWEFPWTTKYGVNATTPIVFDEKVFISSGYDFGCVMLDISKSKPKILWKHTNMRNHFNSSVLWEGHIYGFDEKMLKCLDAGTGKVLWAQGGMGKGSLMIADGKMVIMGEDGTLAVAPASPKGYKAQASAKVLDGVCWTVPVLSGGRIYCRNDQGHLVCLDVSGD